MSLENCTFACDMYLSLKLLDRLTSNKTDNSKKKVINTDCTNTEKAFKILLKTWFSDCFPKNNIVQTPYQTAHGHGHRHGHAAIH